MPIDYKHYPENWLMIRAEILARENHCCKWCGVPNRAVGYRDENGIWVDLTNDPAAIEVAEFVDGIKLTKICLTVAHLGTPHPDGRPGDKHDKHDCRPENLAALCQRCHLNYDLPDHVRHARETRERKRLVLEPMLPGL